MSGPGNVSAFAMYKDRISQDTYATIQDSRVALSIFSSSQNGYLFLRNFTDAEVNTTYSISAESVRSSIILLSSQKVKSFEAGFSTVYQSSSQIDLSAVKNVTITQSSQTNSQRI